MRTLRAKLIIVAGLILTSPVAALAGDPEKGAQLWDWLVRLLTWTAGGWHLY